MISPELMQDNNCPASMKAQGAQRKKGAAFLRARRFSGLPTASRIDRGHAVARTWMNNEFRPVLVDLFYSLVSLDAFSPPNIKF
jgi:hypothetical protein